MAATTSEQPGESGNSKHRKSGFARKSQTTLLLEYFERGMGPDGLLKLPNPYIRVRVSSSARKVKDAGTANVEGNDHRKPSYTKWMLLEPKDTEDKRGLKIPNNHRDLHDSVTAAGSVEHPIGPESARETPHVSVKPAKISPMALDGLPGKTRTRDRSPQPSFSTGKLADSSDTQSHSDSKKHHFECHCSKPRGPGQLYKEGDFPTTSRPKVNEKLLSAVETAVRRLIMPELETLRLLQEQERQRSRHKSDENSVASYSGVVPHGKKVKQNESTSKNSLEKKREFSIDEPSVHMPINKPANSAPETAISVARVQVPNQSIMVQTAPDLMN